MARRRHTHIADRRTLGHNHARGIAPQGSADARFIGWIFYDKEKTKIWTETYSTFIYCSGMILFPFTLLDIYFRLPPAFMTIIAIILLASIKLLSLYKWNRLFFNKKHSYVRLILYFCSLEIIPCLLAYKGIFLIEKIS